MVAVTVLGGSLGRLDGGDDDALKRDLDGIELGLHVGHASTLHFDLVLLA